MRPKSVLRYPLTLLLACALPLALFATGCGDDEEQPNEPELPTTSNGFITGASAGGADGVYSEDTMPVGEGVAPTILGTNQIVPGGSIVLEVTMEDTAQEMYVSVSGAVGGYYAIDLVGEGGAGIRALTSSSIATLKGIEVSQTAPTAEGLNTYNLNVTSAVAPGFPSFTINIGANHGEAMTAIAGHAIIVNEVAQLSENLQVSLNWTQPVDMDLHVTVPNGSQIYFGNRVGPNGGTLDLDSNPACAIDGINNENTTWADAPAAGSYRVGVNLWSACDISANFPYVVTVNIAGQVQVFEGSISSASASPGSDGEEVTTFVINPAG